MAFKLTPIVAIAILGCLAPSASARNAAPDAQQDVRIETGALRGDSVDGIIAFKGIPFAAPPVGELRWRAPQPASSWSGTRDATHYGHDCMQNPFPSDAAPLGTPPAEDCLYLNIWKPAAAKGKLPVMVWIYGGGFVNGGSSPPTYSGAELAKKGIMVVSFNYRLGRFGTFAHPQLTKADADHGLIANYGYMDQLYALQWVQRNIAAFGGDPSNVTIVGESAGGISVHMLITSPMAQGLFQKAVVMSGGPVALGDSTLASAEAIGIAFAQSKNIQPDDPQALAKLRALDAEQVTDGLNLATLFAAPEGPRTFASPIADGRIAVDVLDAYRGGRFAHVPMMVGATSDDIGGANGPMATGARTIADTLTRQGVPTYYYRFSYVADAARAGSKGAQHATDIPFFFHTEAIKYGRNTSSTDRDAGQLASSYLTNFVKTNAPQGEALPHWPAYSMRKKRVLDLNAQGGANLKPDIENK